MQASFEDREDDELVEPLFAALRKDVGEGPPPRRQRFLVPGFVLAILAGALIWFCGS